MNSKIKVTQNRNETRRDVYTFILCASISGIAMTLDTYSAYRLNPETEEWVAFESYIRTDSVAANAGARFAGMNSRENILTSKSVPAAVQQEAKNQLLDKVEFVN